MNPIRYHSTRGTEPLSFADAVLAGLAPDGGLYVPDHLPHFAPYQIAAWQGMPYAELAAKILWPFLSETISEAELLRLCEDTYAVFRHPAVAPLKQIGTNDWLLELFHGPTLAFKDFALQFLGRLLARLLEGKERVTILGATSGDTGSAAIHGLAGQGNFDIVILFPYGRVSDIQRRQMTTVADAHVHVLAIDGSFDDCQKIVKTLFVDAEFRAAQRLVAVNSINWMRILAQTVYYFHAGLALGAPARRAAFSVPTGNFGDIYAGYLARRMGLPIEKLLIATNRNDILARTLRAGLYEKTGVSPSLSPSMDIEVSSNFERLLYDLYDADEAAVRALIGNLAQSGRFALSEQALARLRALFAASCCDDATTLETIRRHHREQGELIDPHTAVGIHAACRLRAQVEGPIVTLATAHPAKFGNAVEQATGIAPALPLALESLLTGKERYTRLWADAAVVKDHILTVLQ